jgi:hypothetical protein
MNKTRQKWCVECLSKRNQTKLQKWLNDENIELTYPFICRTLLLQFLCCDVHNREGDDKMSVENEKMQAKLCSV